MSQKFKKVLANPKTSAILNNVLQGFGLYVYPKVVTMLMKDPDITDDAIFQELAKDEKKTEDSFNKFKLTGVTNLVKYIITVKPGSRILDFGGANCAAAHNLAETYGIRKVDVADVVDRVAPKGVKFTKLEVGKKLPYMDGEFDIVFCMMTLHHIKDVEETIKELHRICNKWLIIQEHDAVDGYSDILDIVHGMYIFVKNDDDYEKLERFTDFVAWYKSLTEWDALLKKYFSMRWMKRTKSAQNNYFALYEKN